MKSTSTSTFHNRAMPVCWRIRSCVSGQWRFLIWQDLHRPAGKWVIVLRQRPSAPEIRKGQHQYLTFSVNTPAQLALADMLRAEPEHYLALPDFYRQKRDILVNALNESRLEILPCEGTYFLLVDYSEVSTLDDVEFCQWLTQEHGVAAIPLSVFCADPFPHKLIRLCFAKKESTLLAAAERLRQL